MKKSIVLFFVCLSCTLFSQNRESDSLAMVQIYNDLNGDDWIGFDTWMTEAPIDEWEGTLMSNDRVTRIELKNADAVGVFPMSVLDLTELRTLEIRRATISGVIPEELKNLEFLNRLVLSQCGMTGTLPAIFQEMTQLTTLVLDSNAFTGPLPDIHDNYFLIYINNNEFSGEVPASWTNKTVRAVQIQWNQLEGSMDKFSTWSGYTSMNLSYNNWDESTFPEWVDDNEDLERFDCENCNLTGDLPESLDFSNSPNYRNMQLSGNNLSGDISLLFNSPDSEEELFLRVRENNFSGEFPAHKMRLFHEIDLRSNKYESISEFSNDIILNRIDIRYNNFNFTMLEPLKEYIALDSIVGVLYENQSPLLELDSLVIVQPMTLTVEAGDTDEGTTYQWYRNNQAIENATAHDFTLALNSNIDGGSFHCRMKNEDYPELELRRNIVYLLVDISTATNEVDHIEFYLFPNPAQSHLNLSSSENISNAQYQIIDMHGRKIQKGIIGQNQIVSIENLLSGIYTLTIIQEEKIAVQKFSKM